MQVFSKNVSIDFDFLLMRNNEIVFNLLDYEISSVEIYNDTIDAYEDETMI